MDDMTRDDWERIAHALSQYRHNPQFDETYQKVRVILAEL
jgi:hypothetical protein